MTKRDWRAIRQAEAQKHLAAFYGGPRERFRASLAVAARNAAITGSPVLVEKCLQRWADVVQEILSESLTDPAQGPQHAGSVPVPPSAASAATG